jgi:aromatic ring-opening dioxygenase catalytic subunit (LigB family)
MRYPSVFVNHGGGPFPLLGKQPDIVQHVTDLKNKFLPKEPPQAIVVISAHFESNPITITSSAKPPMLYDYHNCPPEAYQIQYPAPGSPDLAKRIQELLSNKGIPSQLDDKRGFDNGVFVPLKIMYPKVLVL